MAFEKIIKKHKGLLICVCALITYFLLRLPLNLSVLCSNENQGFAFVFGQSFLNYGELALGRGILFVLLYAAVLKLFGFGTWSIVAIHIVETIIFISIGIFIYLIVKKVLENKTFAGLAVLFWVIFILTPIGGSDFMVELRSHYNLHGEPLSVFFAVLSILCLSYAHFFNIEQLKINKKEQLFSFFSGMFSVCSFMSKTSGGILPIAIILLSFYLFLFKKETFQNLKANILCCLLGIVLGLVFFNFVFYLFDGNLVSSWQNYFLIGRYGSEHFSSFPLFVKSVFDFLSRSTSSLNNFVLILFAMLLFIYSLIRNFSVFWLLVSLWGLGGACVVVIPGAYQPYYYHLIWVQISIAFVLVLYELIIVSKNQSKKIAGYSLLALILLLFIARIVIFIPVHYGMFEELSDYSVFKQPQSFQDPVSKQTSSRAGFLQLADEINKLVPDKQKTIFLFNLYKEGHTGLTPLTYMYAKRYPSTSVPAGLLLIPNALKPKLKVLKQDLIKRSPDVVVIADENYLKPWQVKPMTPFLKWFDEFIKENYILETNLSYIHTFDKNQTEIFNVFRKVK